MDALTVGAGLGLGAISIVGSYLDLRYRRLPNWLCGLALVSGLAFIGLSGGAMVAGLALAHTLLALLVGIGLFALGGIGGGDAKFYSALAAWFPLRNGFLLLGAVALAGLILLIGWMLWRRRRRRLHGGRVSADDPFGKLPYGLAISVGAMTSFLLVN